MRKINLLICYFALLILFNSGCKKDDNSNGTQAGILQLIRVKVGTIYLDQSITTKDIPVDKGIVMEFSSKIDTNSVRRNIIVMNESGVVMNYELAWLDENKSVVLNLSKPFENQTNYTLQLKTGLVGILGETFSGMEYKFRTINGKLALLKMTLNGQNFLIPGALKDVDFKKITIEAEFSYPLDPSTYSSFFVFSGTNAVSYSISSDNKKVTLSHTELLKSYTKYYFSLSSNLTASNGYMFDGFSNYFYTDLDYTPKFPFISDDNLLTLIQKQTFKYFWDFGHPTCGLARERNTSGDVITIGGSGFGVMTFIVAMERGFISRSDGLLRINKILNFLETCDRYHGVWPHWLNGLTGKTIPFSPKDDGGDLVETSFMIQGLLTFRQYLKPEVTDEKKIIDRINILCNSVEYDWFTQSQETLYWHWSPNYGWAMNVKLQGYNETLITYILAASSTTHTIQPNVYKNGFARNGAIRNGKTFYNYKLPLGEDYGGPLFFAHYSFLGLDPRNLKDVYANFWEQNVNQSIINWSYCTANPKKNIGYSTDCWGLTASDNEKGYNAHSPTNDLGVISPTAALSSIPYTPEQSMKAIRHFYYRLGDRTWGEFGFYDAFNVTAGWWANSYLAIDQGPIICMIENDRTGLLWKLFMSCPEVKNGLTKLEFTYN